MNSLRSYKMYDFIIITYIHLINRRFLDVPIVILKSKVHLLLSVSSSFYDVTCFTINVLQLRLINGRKNQVSFDDEFVDLVSRHFLVGFLH